MNEAMHAGSASARAMGWPRPSTRTGGGRGARRALLCAVLFAMAAMAGQVLGSARAAGHARMVAGGYNEFTSRAATATAGRLVAWGSNGHGQTNVPGMALERVLLEATIAGVSASFFTQPLEVAHLRRLYDEGRPSISSQMIFRLGYARPPGASPSPRRPVADVLIDT